MHKTEVQVPLFCYIHGMQVLKVLKQYLQVLSAASTETVLAAEPLLEFRMSTAIWNQFLSEGSNKGEAWKASQLQ